MSGKVRYIFTMRTPIIDNLPQIETEEKNEYEIAKEENTTQQAINKNLHQAIKKLKEILKK